MHKRTAALLLLLSLGAAWLLPCPALGEGTPVSAPLTQGPGKDGTVRVRLASLGNPEKLTFTFQGPYTAGDRTLPAGSTATVSLNRSSGQLTLTSAGTSTAMGRSLTLRRQGGGGVKIAQSREKGSVYPADLELTASGSGGSYSLTVIAALNIEEYLYGVLPYEMGSGSGLEALKAQAVAARTYTLRAMSRAAGRYDVVDTTADQVYSGTPAGNEACRAAVDATKGIVIQNGGELTATYYTASNGGQTESVKNAWGSPGPAYLTVKDDPYDLSNPESRVKSFFVAASGPQSNQTLSGLLSRKAAAAFGPGAAVTAVRAVVPHTPRFAIPSRVYTKLDFEVDYRLNGQTASGILTFDIFGELEGPLGMGINSDRNEIWSVAQSGNGFTVSARRFGHGVGMSQRGAMQMAKMGYTYDQILGFYYEGCVRVQYSFSGSSAPVPAPAVTAPPPAALTALVATESGPLNLRQEPNTAGKVLCAIPQYAEIAVYQRGEDWCRAGYAGFTGYVMTRYLAFTDDETGPLPSEPAPAPPQGEEQAQVVTGEGSLNLRSEPRTGARVLRTVPRLDWVTVLERGSEWCKVYYEGTEGYAMSRFLAFTGPVPASPPQAAETDPTLRLLQTPVLARIACPLSSLNLREGCSTQARLLLEMPRGDYLTLLQAGDTWCFVDYQGHTGYCMTQYLEFELYE